MACVCKIDPASLTWIWDSSLFTGNRADTYFTLKCCALCLACGVHCSCALGASVVCGGAFFLTALKFNEEAVVSCLCHWSVSSWLNVYKNQKYLLHSLIGLLSSVLCWHSWASQNTSMLNINFAFSWNQWESLWNISLLAKKRHLHFLIECSFVWGLLVRQLNMIFIIFGIAPVWDCRKYYSLLQ